MCLVALAWKAHPDFPLVVAANRDEWRARPAAPAHWWEDRPGLLAGRDLEAGGTWMGVTRGGRFCAVTNFRDPSDKRGDARSRGELVADFLSGIDSPAAYCDSLARRAGDYNGFNLLAGDDAGAHWASNRGGSARRLAAGVHGLSNALLDTPWPKLVRTTHAVRAWLAEGDADTAPLFAALADRARPADAELPDTGVTRDWERLLSSAFIVSERYGTRCSTVLTVDRAGRAVFRERTFDVAGAPAGETVETFAVR